MPAKLLFALVSWVLMLGNTNSLLVVTYPGPGGHVVASMDPTTGAMETLLTVGEVYTRFSLAPTEDQLAYVAWNDATVDGASPISYYIVDLADGEPRQVGELLDGTNVGNPEAPVWSPDGTHLAVHTDAGLTIVNANDRSSFNLTELYKGLVPVKWSPDSQKLIFNTLTRDGRVSSAYVISVELGAEPQLLLEGGEDVHDGRMLWMPDSEQIVLQRNERYSSENSQVFMINLETGVPVTSEITFSALPEAVIVRVLDETKLLLSVRRDGKFQWVPYDLLTGQHPPLRNSLTSGAYCAPCSISPDAIYYASSNPPGPRSAIKIYDRATGSLITEASADALIYPHVWLPDSTSVIYQVDGSGLYRLNVEANAEPQPLNDHNVEVIGWINR